MCVLLFSFPRQELEEFARIALKYNLFIISDEVRVFGVAFAQREGLHYLRHLAVIERPRDSATPMLTFPAEFRESIMGYVKKNKNASMVLFEFGSLSDECSRPPGCLHSLLLLCEKATGIGGSTK